jgi:hypothetical protein
VNKTQKLILAIFVPVIFFFIAVFVAKQIDPRFGLPRFGLLPVMTSKALRFSKAVDYRGSILFALGETWYVWLLYSASCCLFEFLLFRDNKIISRKNKED